MKLQKRLGCIVISFAISGPEMKLSYILFTTSNHKSYVLKCKRRKNQAPNLQNYSSPGYIYQRLLTTNPLEGRHLEVLLSHKARTA